ncbi:efflux RND transporter permease subunit [Vibrio gazogenes]|uniref:SSD domain-containing protein n=1 Tax=Vibrio gazogenes TaxID=687 RepID=A0A1Z2SG02_VIBGA|nr:efflux RND transporter permease subunit [Vibrio gazogenes]ASA56078.1 hypothetical protein BSQ33_10470 [Vibrio gazogenes]
MMAERYLNFVFRYPKSILVLLVLITGYFLMALGNLSEDNNPYFLPESHPARHAIYEIREEFTGTYDSVLIVLYNPDTIFNQASLDAIFELTKQSRVMTFVDETDEQRLIAIRDRYTDQPQLGQVIDQILADGLTQSDGYLARDLYEQSAEWGIRDEDRRYISVFAERVEPIREMAGLAATENVFIDDDGTIIARKTINNYGQDPEVIKGAVLDNELMEKGTVDPSGHVAMITVELSLHSDDAYGQVRAYEQFKQMVADYRASHPEFKDEVYVGGVPVFFAAQKQVIDHDFGTLLPLVLLLIAVILAVFFRSVLGVVLPLLNVVMCTIWTLGMMAIIQAPLDIITAVLPVFLITICSSDAIHMMAEYYHQKKIQKSRLPALRKATLLMISPVVLTTVTTCFTFTLSTSTSIESLRNFGIFISFGMFVALIISLLLIPACLALFPGKSKGVTEHTEVEESEERAVARKYLISRILIAALQPVIHNRGIFTGIFILLLGGASFLATQVKIDDMGSGYFAKDSVFRIADTFINDHIAGTSPGWVQVDSGSANGALSLKMLRFIDQLETFIHQQEYATYSYSAARYVRRINYTLNDFEPSYNRLPEDVERFVEIDPDTGEKYDVEISGRDIVRQSILMYENSGGTDTTNVYNEDFSKTVLLYTLGTTVASDYQAFLGKLRPWLAENTPQGYQVKLAGSPVIWTAVLDALVMSQTQSAVIALFIVLAVMSLWMRSLKLGIAGTLPLVTTVMCYFSLMTILDIELNIGTAIISFLVLGIVDYSVHYILRIQLELKQGGTIDEALLNAVSVSGRAIIANVLVFSIGFVALLFSQYKPLVDLGTLVGLSLLISGIMTLFVVTLFAPWFFSGMQREKVNEKEALSVN